MTNIQVLKVIINYFLLQRKDSYNEHLLIHNGPRHKCPHCPKEFVQRSNLVRHIRIHTGKWCSSFWFQDYWFQWIFYFLHFVLFIFCEYWFSYSYMKWHFSQSLFKHNVTVIIMVHYVFIKPFKTIPCVEHYSIS